MTDDAILALAREEVATGGFMVCPSDVATVEVRRRKHWWSLRSSWVTIGSFDAHAQRRESSSPPGAL